MDGRTKFIGLWLLLAGALLGCTGAPQVGTQTRVPHQLEALPVTPITPPAGIRSTLQTDPSLILTAPAPQPTATNASAGWVRNNEVLYLCYPNPSPHQPIEAYAEAPAVFTVGIYVHVCGWAKQVTQMDVTVTLPDGTTFTEPAATQYQDNAIGRQASFLREFIAADVSGQYQIAFAGDGLTFSTAFEVVLPSEPRLYLFPNGDVWLYGFQPNETVQLLRYDVSEREMRSWPSGSGIAETFVLVGQDVVTVDADGTKSVPQFAAPANEEAPYGRTSHIVGLDAQSNEIAMHFGFPPIMWVEKSVIIDE